MEFAPIWELAIIFVLILLNGFFAGAEIAVLTARRSRMEQKAQSGERSARLALGLIQDPNQFLATVQVGITFVATFAAAFGGASLVEPLVQWLSQVPPAAVAEHANAIALTIVTLGIAFVSLIVGELVPKRIALRNAEGLALIVAPPMAALRWIARPIVWFLGVCTNAVLFLLRSQDVPERSVSLEDIQHLIQTGTSEGLLEPVEHRAAVGALRLGDRPVREIQVPRVEMKALDVATPPDRILAEIVEASHTRLPVYEEDLDHIIGFIYIKDVLRSQLNGEPLDLRAIMRSPLLVPETLTVDRLLQAFQAQRTVLAIVLDEYGGTEGMVTLEDVVEELVGEIHDELQEFREEEIVRRDSESWLVDGSVALATLLSHLPIPTIDAPATPGVSTVAGLVLSQLGRVPKVGEVVTWWRLRIEVVDMDGRRIDRLLVSLPPIQESEEEGETTR